MRQKCKQLLDRTKAQTGAIVVEATISLTTFIFVMFSMMSIAQMAYTQAKVAVSLDSVARELAQYTHIWYATGMDQTFSGEGGQSSGYAGESAQVVKAVGEFFGKLSKIGGGALGDATGLTPLFETSEKIFSGGGAALEGDSLTNYITHYTGEGVTLAMLKSRLIGWKGDTPEQFMKRNHIQNLKMGPSKFLEGNTDVFVSVKYDIQVVRLLNLDIKLHMNHFSYTQAWGGGKE